MNAVQIGVLSGIVIALVIVVYATVRSGIETIGWKPLEIIKGSWPCFKDKALIRVTLELMLWCGLHGLMFGMAFSGGALTAAAVSSCLWYLLLACGYRYLIAKKQGVSYHPRPRWKQFWAVREAIGDFKSTDQKTYNTFYMVSIGIGLFWYWIGLFDFAK